MATIDRIITLLNNRNIVPSKMMKELGFSNGLFSQWKSGLQKPSADKIFKIAEYLSVSTDYLLERTDNPDINTNIRTGDVSGVNINGNTNTNVNIGTPSKEQDTADLVEIVQDLPLVKRAKVITYIDEIKKEE